MKSLNKISIITCYREPDYIRAMTLRNGLRMTYGAERVIEVKNHQRGAMRYLEVCWKVVSVRLKYNPDVYLVTFRGYEILLPVRLLTLGKKLVFDEFINFEEWLEENNKLQAPLVKRMVGVFYRLIVKTADRVLTDTETHANYSAKRHHASRSKFYSVPVSTDEETFQAATVKQDATRVLKVFYYGSMLPLHGLQYVLDALEALQDKEIELTLIGGKEEHAGAIQDAIEKGARINYIPRVPYKKLAAYISRADLCLGGPFGNTLQSRFVITGKTYQFLSAGKAVLVGKNEETDLTPDVFLDKKNCIMVEQGSSVSLQEALLWAYHHKEELPSIGRNGSKLYQDHFSNTVISKILADETFYDYMS